MKEKNKKGKTKKKALPKGKKKVVRKKSVEATKASDKKKTTPFVAARKRTVGKPAKKSAGRTKTAVKGKKPFAATDVLEKTTVPAQKEQRAAEVREKPERPLPVSGQQKKRPRKADVITRQPEKKEPEMPPKAPVRAEEAPVDVLEAREEPPAAEAVPRELEVKIPVTVKELAAMVNIKSNQLIAYLMDKGTLATINQNLGGDIVKTVVTDFGFTFKKQEAVKGEIEGLDQIEKDSSHYVSRPPVVTFMGHVDHGKTSLLDYIRKTRVVDREKGGITQHIGASVVNVKGGSVTFLDTPGHEAFTAMRARGAHATDVVVLVVAADDGVMPQTKEAIDHARSAEVPIVVALNKCDLPGAHIDRVKRQLNEIGLIPEDWGGKTIVVPVSAKTGEGVDSLLEMLLLEAEMLELKANHKIRARGVVIEGKLTSGEGVVTTVLVRHGILRRGDVVLTGMYYGRIKAMADDRGKRVDQASPSIPVSILGLSGVPMAGDEFYVVKDELKAKAISLLKKDEEREDRLRGAQRVTLEDFYWQSKERGIKELRIVLKADVQGSIEALRNSLEGLSTKDVKVHLIHAGVGSINDSDVLLALASSAVVIGFHVKLDTRAEETAKKENVEVKNYGIIYEAIADVKAAMEGLLEPVQKEVFVGRAQVRQVFNVSRVGVVAGSFVLKGRIIKSGVTKLVRNKTEIFKGRMASLKRFKDDAREVREGFECGISLEKHKDIKIGDIIEVYQVEMVARRLDSRK